MENQLALALNVKERTPMHEDVARQILGMYGDLGSRRIKLSSRRINALHREALLSIRLPENNDDVKRTLYLIDVVDQARECLLEVAAERKRNWWRYV